MAVNFIISWPAGGSYEDATVVVTDSGSSPTAALEDGTYETVLGVNVATTQYAVPDLTVSISGVHEAGRVQTASTNAAAGATYQWLDGGTPISGATASTYTPGATIAALTVTVTSGAQSATSAPVAITAASSSNDEIVNLGAATRGVYRDAHGLPTTMAIGEKVWFQAGWYHDGVSTYTLGRLMAWTNPLSDQEYVELAQQRVRIRSTTSSDSTNAAYVTGSARWILNTWMIERQSSNSVATVWREGTKIVTASTVSKTLSDTLLAALTRFSVGYIAQSGSASVVDFPFSHVAWGTGDPTQFDAAVYNGGTWTDPATYDDASDATMTMLGVQNFLRVGDASPFSIAQLPDMTAVHGTGHAWVAPAAAPTSPASLPF